LSLDLDEKIATLLANLDAKDKAFAIEKYNKLMEIAKIGGDVRKEVEEIKKYANNK